MPAIHRRKLNMVCNLTGCLYQTALMKRISTGLVATNNVPSPADTSLMAITYKPRYNEIFRNPYTHSCLQIFRPAGNGFRIIPWLIVSISVEASAKRATGITRGWDE